MKNPPARVCLCLFSALLVLTACSSPKSSNSVEITNTHPHYVAPSPRTAAEEAAKLQADNAKRLDANLPQFASPPPSSRLTGRPYINGKAIALSQDLEETEYTKDTGLIGGYGDIDIAGSPEEVGTVVLVKFRKQKIGTYTTTGDDHIPGYVLIADLIIVDQSIPAVIYRKTFRGKRPEEYVSISAGTDEIVGEDPRDAISEFLEKLPRK